MFWGLIMEPHRRYTQQVKKAFHVSMASLDVSTSSNEPSQIMLGYEGRNYLLCTLQKNSTVQCPLDLNFEVGTEVSFAANGKGHVHLTGYLIPEDYADGDQLDEEEIEDEDNALEEESSAGEEEEGQEIEVVQGKKRSRQSLENGQPNKKSKVGKVTSSQQDEEDSDESDDEDFNEMMCDGDEEAEDEEDDDEEEDSDAEEEEDASSLSEDDDEDDDVEEEQEEEEQVGKKKKHQQQQAKMNGVTKNKEITGQTKKDNKTNVNQKENGVKDSKKRTLSGGIIVEDLKEGQGQGAKKGRFVNVYYQGRLKSNNKMFDSTTKGSGFSFRLGSGEVIKGWDIGVEGMKPGGKRRIICPPNMAYGARGSPPAIPPNATLVFDVELRKIS